MSYFESWIREQMNGAAKPPGTTKQPIIDPNSTAGSITNDKMHTYVVVGVSLAAIVGAILVFVLVKTKLMKKKNRNGNSEENENTDELLKKNRK